MYEDGENRFVLYENHGDITTHGNLTGFECKWEKSYPTLQDCLTTITKRTALYEQLYLEKEGEEE